MLKRIVIALSLLAVPAGGLAPAVRAWTGSWPDWGVAGRVHYTLVAGLAFVWWAAYWNLLGFRFQGTVGRASTTHYSTTVKYGWCADDVDSVFCRFRTPC